MSSESPGKLPTDAITKTQDEYFRDWESHVIGFGYGSGEPHTIPALRQFLSLCNEGQYNHSYNYEALEAAIGPVITWLFISILAKADIIEYGTSPRFGWLTSKGTRLRDFMLSKTAEELVDTACDHDESYAHCYPNACNCGPNGYEKGRVCQNPFWSKDV